MLRTMSTLRKLSLSVFAGLALHAATAVGSAQDAAQPKDLPPAVPGGGAADGKTMIAVINITKTVGMTRPPGAAEDPIIEKVQNENPKVVRIQSIFNDPRHVLITGLAPGTSRVIFTGYSDPNMKDRRDEVFEVRVISDDAIMREQLRKEFLSLVKKTNPTANIDAIVVFSTTAGPVTVTSTSGNNAPETVNKSGTTDNRMVVFLTGNVLTADGVVPILESARAMFGLTATIVNNMTVGGVQQVEVDCVICSVNRSKLRNMSFSWALNRKDWFLASILGSGNFTNSIATGVSTAATAATTSGGNLVFGAVNNDGSFFGFLQALRTDGLAKIQAEPKVVTLSGRPAQFVSGGETPILTTSGQGAPNVTYKTFGTTITVLPIILGNGKIHLEIAPLISTLNQANGISITGGNTNTQVPGFNTQGAQVAVQVEDGQTIAIGGLIQHTVNATNAKVPLLGDVPFIGAAFRTVNYDEREQELIILVTPRLIDPMGCDQLPAKLPTRLTRTPDDFELYLEGLLELPRGQRQTCGPNGCYEAPHRIGSTASVFPCGDQANCGINGFGHGGAACGINGCKTGCSPCGPNTTGASATRMGVPSTIPLAMPTTTVESAPRMMPRPATSSATPPTDLPAGSLAPVNYNTIPDGAPASGPALRLPGAAAAPDQ
jgi:pilus assembly protein CpaC